MNMKRGTVIFLLALIVAVMFAAGEAQATGVYFQQIPAGYEQSCDLCHSPVPMLNAFGEEFRANNYEFPPVPGGSAPEAEAPASPAAGPEQAVPTAPETGAAAATEQPVVKPPVEATPAAAVEEPGQAVSLAASVPEEPVASKEELDIRLVLPDGVTRGDKIQLQAEVRVNGSPAAGKEVVFYQETDFFGPGRVELGRAVTDSRGIAVINYWSRALEGDVKLLAAVAGGETGTVEAEGILSQTVAGPLVQPFEGLFIPFVGPWLLAIVVGIVWASYLYAGYQVLVIARSGRTKEEVLREQQTGRQAYA